MTATDVLPASMFIPVPGSKKESQNPSHAVANDEDPTKQAGQCLDLSPEKIHPFVSKRFNKETFQSHFRCLQIQTIHTCVQESSV